MIQDLTLTAFWDFFLAVLRYVRCVRRNECMDEYCSLSCWRGVRINASCLFCFVFPGNFISFTRGERAHEHYATCVYALRVADRKCRWALRVEQRCLASFRPGVKI